MEVIIIENAYIKWDEGWQLSMCIRWMDEIHCWVGGLVKTFWGWAGVWDGPHNNSTAWNNYCWGIANSGVNRENSLLFFWEKSSLYFYSLRSCLDIMIRLCGMRFYAVWIDFGKKTRERERNKKAIRTGEEPNSQYTQISTILI